MNEMDTVREFIVEYFLFGEEDRLTDDTSFLGSNIIDSTGMLELASFLEESFGISIDDEELVPENLDSLNSIGRYINRKQNGDFTEATTPDAGERRLPSMESEVPPLDSPAPTLKLMDHPSTSN